MMQSMTSQDVVSAAVAIARAARPMVRADIARLADGGCIGVMWVAQQRMYSNFYQTARGHYSRIDNLRVLLNTSSTGRPAADYLRPRA